MATNFIDEMIRLQMLNNMKRAAAQQGGQQGRQSGGMSPTSAYRMYSQFGSGGTAGGAAEGAGSGTSVAAWPAAVAAIIAGQHLMSNATDRRTSISGGQGRGHRTGDVFSLDFFTEPWQPYAYEKLGIDRATPGEKTDAAINAIRDGESGWDNLLRSAPGTAAQWFDPTGSVLSDWMSEKGGTLGDVASKAIFPLQWIGRLFK